MAELFKLMGTIVIDATDATQKIDAVITAGADLEAKLNGIGANADSYIGSKSGFSSASVWLGNMLTELTNKAAELSRTIWNTGFNMNLSEEGWIASFKTYLGGDLEAAVALVEQLKQFAVDTPLTMQEVMAQATQLLATGTAPEKLIEVMSMLGDVSRGDMTYFSRIANAYWQIMSTGRLIAQDANQLTQAGVPVWQLVADYFNAIERDGRNDWTKELTRELATQAAQSGNAEMAISSEELYSALMFSTSETGMYFNAMNNAMDTTKGKLQKLQDAFTMFAASLTEPFAEIMGSETLDKMTESFDRFTAWAEENPAVLNNLATALSDLATNGLNVLLEGLRELLTFWDANGEMFNSMLVILGAYMFSTGKVKTGAALMAAGGIPLVDEEINEKREELTALTSDVDLPYVRKQLLEQGQADLWDTYFEDWKTARRAEGYSDEQINSFVDGQFNSFFERYLESGMSVWEKGALEWDMLFNGGEKLKKLEEEFAYWENPTSHHSTESDETDGETEEGTSGSLKWLQENLRNQYWQFASASGMPERGNGYGDLGFGDMDGVLSSINSGINSAGGIVGLIASVQGLTAAVQSMTGEIPSAISAGVGNISVTGTVTTGDVMLDTGAVVGQIAPRMNLVLGGINAMSARG